MSPLTESTKLVLAKSYVGTDDPDGAAYITTVEAADTAAGQSGGLETAVKVAIHSFVKGCKADGIWSAIKASCILAGARTLNGALVPLVGTAPTNVNFVSGDYNRKTGLVGNGTTKYLNSNRSLTSDPQDSTHLSVCVSTATTGALAAYCGASGATTSPWAPENSIGIYTVASPPFLFIGNRSGDSTGFTANNSNTATGFIGSSRSSSSIFQVRYAGNNGSQSVTSSVPASFNQYIYCRNKNNSPVNFSNGRLSFYSIGESIDLAKLDARVTALINAFAAAIP